MACMAFLLSCLVTGMVFERLRMMNRSLLSWVEKSGLVGLRMAPDLFKPVGDWDGAELRRFRDGNLSIKMWEISFALPVLW